MFLQVFDNIRKNTQGYSVLFAVIILGSIAIVSLFSLLMVSKHTIQSNKFLIEKKQARLLAESCIEYALHEIQNDESFNGILPINTDQGSCTYAVTITGDQPRYIESEGNSGRSISRIVVDVGERTPYIIINSWQEVASF